MYIWTKIKVVQQFLVPRRSDMVYHCKRVEWKIVNVFFFLRFSRVLVDVSLCNVVMVIISYIMISGVEYIIKSQVLWTSCRPLLKSLQNNNFNIHYTVLDRIMNNCIKTIFFLTILFFVGTSNQFSIYYNLSANNDFFQYSMLFIT